MLVTFGLFASSIFNYLLYYSNVYPESSLYYFTGIFYGIALSLSSISLYSLPMLFIRKHKIHPQSLVYATYGAIIFLIHSVCVLINDYALQSEVLIQVPWYLCNITIFLSCICSFIIGLYLIIYAYAIRQQKPSQLKELLELTKVIKSRNEKEILSQESLSKFKSLFTLLIYFPIECIVLVFSILCILAASGFFNIYFFLQFSPSLLNSYVIDLFCLPAAFFICVISMSLAFPEVSKSLLGVILWRRSRHLLGFETHQTIGARLQNNSGLSLAQSYLISKKPRLWDALNNRYLTPKAAIMVVPDHVFLENYEHRVQTFELFEDSKLENIEHRICSNGQLIINDEEVKKASKNEMATIFDETTILTKKKVFSLDIFKQPFFFFVFTAYCIFFMIPIFYRYIERSKFIRFLIL